MPLGGASINASPSPSTQFIHSSSSSNSLILTTPYIHHQGRDMDRKPGDWNCRSCQHLNFSRRDSCHRCGEPRSSNDRGDHYGSFGGRSGSSFGGFTGSDVRPGDWYCSAGNCGAHNFASRSNCFKCGAFKEESSAGSGYDAPRSRGSYGFGSGGGFGGSGGGFGGSGGGRSGWKSGDWICSRSGCNEHNFASRMECYRCNAPRESGNHSPY